MQPHRWWRNHSLASVKSENTSSCFGINLYSSDLRFQVSFAISTSCLDEIPAGSPAEYQDFDSSIRRCCVQFPLTSTQPRRAFESNFIYTPKIQRISFRAFFKAKSLLRFGKLCKIMSNHRNLPRPGIAFSSALLLARLCEKPPGSQFLIDPSTASFRPQESLAPHVAVSCAFDLRTTSKWPRCKQRMLQVAF